MESDYVSQNLHKWIDLIFGCKQKGEEAEKALNMYVNICYEGSINLDKLIEEEKKNFEYNEQKGKGKNIGNSNAKIKNSDDPKKGYSNLKAKICQINCFGQMPLQLLTIPHKKRKMDLIKKQQKKFLDFRILNPVPTPQLLKNSINTFLNSSNDNVI